MKQHETAQAAWATPHVELFGDVCPVIINRARTQEQNFRNLLSAVALQHFPRHSLLSGA